MEGGDEGDKVRRLKKALDNPDAILRQIGTMLVAASQQAFRDQAWDGTPWKPRRVPNVMGIIADFAAGKSEPPARRFQDRPALMDTGRLSGSVAFRIIGSNSLEVGSNLPYANLMQEGGESESAPLTGSMREAIAKWLDGRGSPWRKKLGWLLAPKFAGKSIRGRVHPRPFVGLTKDLIEDAKELVGVKLKVV